MTGALKRQKIKILQTLEDSDASIYSSIFGYWHISGVSDWAVMVCSCFKCNDSSGISDSDKGEWRIGTGGALIVLLMVEGEWDKMHLKLQSVFWMFGAECQLTSLDIDEAIGV